MLTRLHRLIYSSEARPPSASDGEEPTSVWDIASDASTTNAQCNVFGVLIAVRRHFVQILEGEAGALEEVFERINRDLRHRSISLIDYRHRPSATSRSGR